MTREERQYFYKQLKKMFEEWLVTTTQTNIVYSDLTSFAEKYMQTITGQQFLPQDVFRVFLSEYVPIVVGGLEGKQDKYDEGLKTADKTVVGGINEVYDSVPPFAFFEQNEDGTYTIVLPHKSVYAPASDFGLYIEVSLPNECFENTVALYYDLVMPLVSGVEANEDGEDTKTVTMYL